jgi:HD-GYP domain-containing protein (c-di-GMP phosphodiesterase class II)
MKPIVLDFPVQTLDGKTLMVAGTPVDDDSLQEMLERHRHEPPPSRPLLRHGSIAGDLEVFMERSPYQEIFSDATVRSSVLALMQQVEVPPAVLRSLDHFRARDFYTYRHILLVFAVATRLAQELVTNHRDVIQEAMAGPTHDFGKICVPLEVLQKTSPLTTQERLHLQHHAAAGYVLLIHHFQNRRNLSALVARDHHEKRDGSGYPQGIRQFDRMVEIVAASDIYDALLSPRPYRAESYDNRTALEELTELAAQDKLSWEVVQALIACNRSTRPNYRECFVSLERRGRPPAENLYGQTATDTNGPGAAEETPSPQEADAPDPPKRPRKKR